MTRRATAFAVLALLVGFWAGRQGAKSELRPCFAAENAEDAAAACPPWTVAPDNGRLDAVVMLVLFAGWLSWSAVSRLLSTSAADARRAASEVSQS